MASEVCMDKGMCKSWTFRSPQSAKAQARKERSIMTIALLNALTVLEGRMSTFL